MPLKDKEALIVSMNHSFQSLYAHFAFALANSLVQLSISGRAILIGLTRPFLLFLHCITIEF